MSGTFTERMAALRELTGSGEGDLRGSVEVNQRYAKYQHERLELRHPRGGGARYLMHPLMDGYARWLHQYASSVLTDGGERAMILAMERLAEEEGVDRHAPVELGDLRASGHPSVRSGSRVVYDRPPRMHRLSPEELKAKSRAVMALRKLLGLPIFWKAHGKIMVAGGRTPFNEIGV